MNDQTKSTRGRWLPIVGAILSVLGIAIVLRAVLADGEALRKAASEPVMIIVGAVFFTVAFALVGLSWWWLTGIYGPRPRALPVVGVWLRTNVAKYLPGNMFHYVGRQIEARRIGLSQASAAGATLLETASLIVASIVVGAGGAAAAGISVPISGGVVIAMLIGCVLAMPLADRLARRLPGLGQRMESLPALGVRRTVVLLLPSVVMHMAFLGATGGIMYWLAGDLDSRPPIGTALWVYALAWLVGTLTPGAPAGAGVREGVLVVLLSPTMGEGGAGALAVVLRIVTTLGELLAWCAGLLMRSRDDTRD